MRKISFRVFLSAIAVFLVICILNFLDNRKQIKDLKYNQYLLSMAEIKLVNRFERSKKGIELDNDRKEGWSIALKSIKGSYNKFHLPQIKEASTRLGNLNPLFLSTGEVLSISQLQQDSFEFIEESLNILEPPYQKFFWHNNFLRWADDQQALVQRERELVNEVLGQVENYKKQEKLTEQEARELSQKLRDYHSSFLAAHENFNKETPTFKKDISYDSYLVLHSNYLVMVSILNQKMTREKHKIFDELRKL